MPIGQIINLDEAARSKQPRRAAHMGQRGRQRRNRSNRRNRLPVPRPLPSAPVTVSKVNFSHVTGPIFIGGGVQNK